MRPVIRTLATGILVLLAVCSIAAAGGTVRGVVADESGGVLPGVTVVATTPDGRVLASAVTNEIGRYAFAGLPAAPVSLTFQLEGFSATVVDVDVKPDVDSPVVTQRLILAPRTETVVVQGK